MYGPLFYSKILLFGEYGIIKDSKGLSIPYNFYNGALKIDEIPDASTHKSNQSLKRFSVYLENLQKEDSSLVSFDIEKLLTSHGADAFTLASGDRRCGRDQLPIPKFAKGYAVSPVGQDRQ